MDHHLVFKDIHIHAWGHQLLCRGPPFHGLGLPQCQHPSRPPCQQVQPVRHNLACRQDLPQETVGPSLHQSRPPTPRTRNALIRQGLLMILTMARYPLHRPPRSAPCSGRGSRRMVMAPGQRAHLKSTMVRGLATSNGSGPFRLNNAYMAWRTRSWRCWCT